jgi:predicted aminopeptidase
MPDPKQHYEKRPTFEQLLRSIPGFRGYLEKEYRRDSDDLQRKWLADRLQRCKPALDALARTLADAAQLDLLPQIDRLRARLDRLIGRIRGAMRGYSGFFDLVQVNEQLLDEVYDYDAQLTAAVELLAGQVEELPAQAAQVATALPQVARQLDELDRRWDGREDLLRGLGGQKQAL